MLAKKKEREKGVVRKASRHVPQPTRRLPNAHFPKGFIRFCWPVGTEKDDDVDDVDVDVDADVDEVGI